MSCLLFGALVIYHCAGATEQAPPLVTINESICSFDYFCTCSLNLKDAHDVTCPSLLIGLQHVTVIITIIISE